MTQRRTSDLSPGAELGGYRLDALIGQGTHSRIFLGTHSKLGRRVAIKVLLVDRVEDPRGVERFVNEARIVNEIRHPNIIDIGDIIEREHPRVVALVMEHIAGPSIKALHESKRRLPFAQAMAIAAQLTDALRAAHAIGVIHRDIKPDNLLLSRDPGELEGEPLALKVVDFGIAKITAGAAPLMTEQMIGTPAYMAPEQISGKPAPSRATDVYAVGEVLYELLSGQRVFAPGSIPELIRRKVRGEIPELAPLRVPGGVRLGVLIRRCLARRPEERPELEEVREVIVGICPEAAPRKRSSGVRARVIGTRAEPGRSPAIPGVSTCPTLISAPERTQILFEETVEDEDIIDQRPLPQAPGFVSRATQGSPSRDPSPQSASSSPPPQAALLDARSDPRPVADSSVARASAPTQPAPAVTTRSAAGTARVLSYAALVIEPAATQPQPVPPTAADRAAIEAGLETIPMDTPTSAELSAVFPAATDPSDRPSPPSSPKVEAHRKSRLSDPRLISLAERVRRAGAAPPACMAADRTSAASLISLSVGTAAVIGAIVFAAITLS